MHAPVGVHAGPKWKQVPAPLDWHEKYVLTPAWYTHVGTRQATSFGDGPGWPTAPEPGPATGPGPGFAALPLPAAAEPEPAGCFGSGGVPHPMVTATTNESA